MACNSLSFKSFLDAYKGMVILCPQVDAIGSEVVLPLTTSIVIAN
jgi:hypothetical protein